MKVMGEFFTLVVKMVGKCSYSSDEGDWWSFHSSGEGDWWMFSLQWWGWLVNVFTLKIKVMGECFQSSGEGIGECFHSSDEGGQRRRLKLAWKQKMGKYFLLQASCGCINIYVTEVLFFFTSELLRMQPCWFGLYQWESEKDWLMT